MQTQVVTAAAAAPPDHHVPWPFRVTKRLPHFVWIYEGLNLLLLLGAATVLIVDYIWTGMKGDLAW